MSETPGQAYERGEAAGQVIARLAGHDKHFASINGQLAALVKELHQLTLAVQRLGDEAIASAATAHTTATALEKADDARRKAAEHRWSPLQRLSALGGILAAMAAVITTYLATKGRG